MTDSPEQRLPGGRFPLAWMPRLNVFQTCRWSCGSKCFAEPSNHSTNETFEGVLKRRLSRRSLLKGAAFGAPLLVIGSTSVGRSLLKPETTVAAQSPSLTFQPISLSAEDRIIVPSGYTSQVVIRWGDPLYLSMPPFDIANQTATSQAMRFGYNNDFIGYFPLPQYRSHNPNMGLLCVNHEYTNPELMFPGYTPESPTKEQVDVELAAHGMSVIEVYAHTDGWRYKVSSRYNRRITGETEIEITGPAAGHEWMQTSYDPTGEKVRGMLNNCAGGKTPWGTVLTCEENFNQYFANLDGLPDSDPRKAVHSRYGIPMAASERRWEMYHDRFDVTKEPNEPFRFGWVVEIDPYDANSVPKKRTALGRFKHEGATVVVSRYGRVVVYSGDDERFEYVYKFVSQGRFSSDTRMANLDLLDQGTLYVAKFNADGTGEWLPLSGGQGPLAAWSQAEVLINTRGAADLLGATKMDRPEDIETNPANGKVYMLMTNNTRRQPDQVDAANPRPNNRHGHVIEVTEDGDDHASTSFTWDIFMLCGDPNNPEDATFFAGFDPAQVSPISSPDNLVFDRQGNMWIATDGQPNTFRRNDGIYAVPVEGPERGYLRQFMSGVPGGEVCGPEFTPDFTTLFCAIQHPGEGGTMAEPLSTWPDGTVPPRPSVIAIVKTAPGRRTIGS